MLRWDPMANRRCFVLRLSLGLMLPSVAWGQASFQGLGQLPGGTGSFAFDVSSNGAVVVGYTSYTGAMGRYEAFLWTAEAGMVGLGDFDGGGIVSKALAVSADGTVVVGSAEGGGPYRWTAQTGLVSLGSLGSPNGAAFGISRDGQVIVGWGDTGAGRESFRWTAQTGIVSIGSLNTETVDSFASDVSADGMAISGQSMSESPNVEAYRWTPTTGMVGLGDLPGGLFYALGWAISDDGEVLVGEAISDIGWEALRWTPETGQVSLDAAVAAQTSTSAQGISADGTIVVGSAGHVGGAMLWHEVYGFRGIKSMLEDEFGLDLTGWLLISAEAITDDKTTLVGYGRNPDDDLEAWRAIIPPPVAGDLDGDRDVDLDDAELFVACVAGPGVHSAPAGCTRTSFVEADLDGDKDVDLIDIAGLITAAAP